VYFAAGARRHVDTDIYSVRLDGSGMTRLSQSAGTHRANFNPTYTQYVDYWSDATTPPQARLTGVDGRERRVIEANPAKDLAEYRLGRLEFVEIKARDGFPMDADDQAARLRPSRRYPRPQHVPGRPPPSRRNRATAATAVPPVAGQSGVIV
jgi:dipeptidyl-peptidase-4